MFCQQRRKTSKAKPLIIKIEMTVFQIEIFRKLPRRMTSSKFKSADCFSRNYFLVAQLRT